MSNIQLEISDLKENLREVMSLFSQIYSQFDYYPSALLLDREKEELVALYTVISIIHLKKEFALQIILEYLDKYNRVEEQFKLHRDLIDFIVRENDKHIARLHKKNHDSR